MITRSRSLHLVVATAALTAGAGLSASCRDIVESEPVDLASELCTLLVQCEAEQLDCPARISDRVLTEGNAAELLGLDGVEDCLADCAQARSCRDQAPICIEPGESAQCDADADCCNFAGGIAACENGDCCVPEGAVCSAARPCCGGLPCDADGHCGDVVCDAPGDACVQNLECCSRLCDTELGQCVRRTCVGPDERCFAGSECCDSFDIEGNPIEMICQPSEGQGNVCVPAEAECVNCDPFSADNCCSEQGLVCYVVGNQQTVCGETTCAPPGAECGSDGDCCEGLRCDDTILFPHCSFGSEP